MDLRKKVFLGFFVILIVTACLITALPVFVISGNYQNLESTYVRTDTNLVMKNFEGEIRSLGANAPDWGAWDDTYFFARGENPDYVEVNLAPATFTSLRASFIIITDEEGTILYGNGFDLANGRAEPASPALLAELGTGRILSRTLEGMTGISGFLDLPEGPVILSTYPILKSDYAGPAEGMVIIGRNIADTEIFQTAGDDTPAISISSVDPSASRTADISWVSGDGEAAVRVRPVSEEVVEGQQVIRDIYGRDALLLTISAPRDIYQQGKETILLFTLLQIAIILIAGTFAIVSLDRGVFARITAIDADITAITRKTEGIHRIRVRGKDELSRLATAMNALLDQIEKNQADLLESEEKFRSIVETSPNLIWELDPEGKFRYVSPVVTTLLGYSPEEMIGRSITDLLPEEKRADAYENLAQMIASDHEHLILDIPACHQEGHIVFLDIRLMRMTGPAGVLKGFRGVAIDITERKKAENTLRMAIKKLTILSTITRHDILNKLSVLRGFLTMMKKSVADPKILEFIAKEEVAAVSIEHQINFTRDYERIGVRSPQWQNVKATISGALCHLDPLPFPVTVDIEGLTIYADPLLEKVFYNIVENSIRHGEKATRAGFSCRESEENLVIVYEDDGIGIPLLEKENIFTRKYFHHTGLALFLSREILGITGIGIRECGNEGTGARFEISVPKAAFRFDPGPQ